MGCPTIANKVVSRRYKNEFLSAFALARDYTRCMMSPFKSTVINTPALSKDIVGW